VNRTRISARQLALAALAALLPLLAISAEGGEPTEAEEPAAHDLIYSVNRTPEPTFETARAVQVITAEEIRRRNARTLPELLIGEVGVFVQQTNYGGGSPILRGLIGKQILILVDGVRLNNSIYRAGPIQYLNTIDLAAVERIEIVRGVGSVLGSDALGGTINVILKRGSAPAEGRSVGARVFTRFSTADQAATGRAEVSGSSAKLRYLGGLTYRDSGSVEGGGGVGEQRGTGYDELGGNFNLDYFLSADKTLSFSYLGLEQSDVPRTDRLSDGTNLVFDFEPQSNQLAAVSFQDLTSRSWVDGIRATAYWNQQDEGRREIRTAAPTTEIRLFDRAETLGANLELSKFVGSHEILWGLDYSQDEIDSSRTDTNLLTGATRARRGSYTDGASYELLAGYIQDRFALGERWHVKLGARYSRFSADGSENSTVGVLDLKSSDDSLTGALNVVFHATESLNLVASATRGFRAPNIEDLSVFDQRSNGTEVPNTNLAPEEITNYEVGAKYNSGVFSGSIFFFRSELSELLVRQPGTLNGLSFFDLNNNGVRDANEPNVLLKKNLGKAEVEGFEFSGSYRPRPEVTIFANFTSTSGDDSTADVPLSRIPPDFGTLGARWQGPQHRRPWVELVLHFAADQTRLSPADRTDSRIGPNGTDGFEVFHLRGGMSFGNSFEATLAVENLSDEEYKYHGSGVFRPGRQAVVGLQYKY
jgi:hemoglobin/transferrin/lactoferrin receptor protein